MLQKYINPNQMILKLKKYSLCLANISKDSIANDMKKNPGLNGYFYEFSVDYVIIDTSDIIDIH